jgi:hypothetical protein
MSRFMVTREDHQIGGLTEMDVRRGMFITKKLKAALPLACPAREARGHVQEDGLLSLSPNLVPNLPSHAAQANSADVIQG